MEEDKVIRWLENTSLDPLEYKQDINAIEDILILYKKEKMKNKELEEVLIDMVNQFAYDEKRKKFENERLYTAGLSALENTFDVLDIDEGIRRKDLWKKI